MVAENKAHRFLEHLIEGKGALWRGHVTILLRVIHHTREELRHSSLNGSPHTESTSASYLMIDPPRASKLDVDDRVDDG